MNDSHPTDPLEFQEWVKQFEEKWLAGQIPDPQGVAVIVINEQRQVLLQLRDDNPHISFANYWSLLGGVVDPNETPDDAAQRELVEETGLRLQLSHWKVYKRRQQDFKPTIEQHVYTGETHKRVSEMIIGEGQALRFFRHDELQELSIAFEFDKLLEEFFSKP
ncbi:MAG: NUDIX domain-containing protein [Caldilineales bacterium]